MKRTLSQEDINFDDSGSIFMYMRKVIDGSLLILEISYNDNLISVEAYLAENRHYLDTREDIEVMRNNKYIPMKLKEAFKLTSQIYDVYIKHICLSLMNKLKYQSVDIIRTLTFLLSIYKSHPPGANSWVYSSSLLIDLGNKDTASPEKIYNYIVKNSLIYDMKVNENSHLPCPVYKVTDITKEMYSNFDIQSPAMRPRLLRQSLEAQKPQGNVKLRSNIRAIVYSYVKDGTEKRQKTTFQLEEGIETQNLMKIRYYVVNYTLSDQFMNESLKIIIKKTEKDIIDVIKLAKFHYRRDNLWEKLRNSSKFSIFKSEEFEELTSACIEESLEDSDSYIKQICALTNVFNSDILSYLEMIYGENSKSLKTCSDIIVFLNNSVFVYLTIIETTKKISLKIVKRTSNITLGDEDNQISEFVAKILHWLWFYMNTHK